MTSTGCDCAWWVIGPHEKKNGGRTSARIVHRTLPGLSVNDRSQGRKIFRPYRVWGDPIDQWHCSFGEAWRAMSPTSFLGGGQSTNPLLSTKHCPGLSKCCWQRFHQGYFPNDIYRNDVSVGRKIFRPYMIFKIPHFCLNFD